MGAVLPVCCPVVGHLPVAADQTRQIAEYQYTADLWDPINKKSLNIYNPIRNFRHAPELDACKKTFLKACCNKLLGCKCRDNTCEIHRKYPLELYTRTNAK